MGELHGQCGGGDAHAVSEWLHQFDWGDLRDMARRGGLAQTGDRQEVDTRFTPRTLHSVTPKACTPRGLSKGGEGSERTIGYNAMA